MVEYINLRLELRETRELEMLLSDLEKKIKINSAHCIPFIKSNGVTEERFVRRGGCVYLSHVYTHTQPLTKLVKQRATQTQSEPLTHTKGSVSPLLL